MTSPRTASSRGQIQPLAALLLGAVAVVAFVAAVVVSRPAGAASPVASPTTRPSAAPSAAPTVAPSAAPSAAPNDGSLTIGLASTSNHDVTLKIHDESGKVAKAVSGTPGDGMSIRWHDADVQNVDARTIAIKWAAFPRDEVVDLGVSAKGGQYLLTFVQAAPYPHTDAMGEDRILILTFDAPVSANDVVVSILDRTTD
jgi:hypothetical protein